MSWFGRARRHRVEILGAPAVGKTTLVYRLAKYPVPDAMVPTAAPVLEKAVEVAGGRKFVFSEQKEETVGASEIIYVLAYPDIDTTALKETVRTGLQPDAALLVLLNKRDLAAQDRVDAVAEELVQIVGTSRSWAVLDCSSQNDDGIQEVAQWLETTLK